MVKTTLFSAAGGVIFPKDSFANSVTHSSLWREAMDISAFDGSGPRPKLRERGGPDVMPGIRTTELPYPIDRDSHRAVYDFR